MPQPSDTLSAALYPGDFRKSNAASHRLVTYHRGGTLHVGETCPRRWRMTSSEEARLDKVGRQGKKETKLRRGKRKKKKKKKRRKEGKGEERRRPVDGGRNASAWVCCLLDNVASKAASLSATINNSRRSSSLLRRTVSTVFVHGVFRPRCEHGGIGVRPWTGWARSVRIYTSWAL